MGRIALIATVSSLGITAAEAQDATVSTGVEDIVVTAQRQAQSLQDVPIAITAFNAEALERQQINNTSDLQLSLPNITFTKGNFTGSNFTIRGVGDASVAASGDTSLGIHVNEIPFGNTRLFETELFDLERVEVLRGPQGTLFGRNATSGVLNFVTARPDLSGFGARGTVEYGNFNSWRLEGMVNVPFGENFGLRVAGTYLKRDGFTRNLFTGNDIDGRDQYAIRGTLRFQNDNTTIDLIAYHFEEDSNRSRIQKQLCNRDPTGVLGCLPDRLDFGVLNGNATLGATLGSRQFLTIASGSPLVGSVGIADVYGPDLFSGQVLPRSLREVNIDFEPTYKSEETFFQAKWEQDFGAVGLSVSGGWQRSSVRSRTDYNLQVGNALNFGPGGGIFNLRNFPLPVFQAGAARLFQGNTICASEASLRYVGFINNEINRCATNSTEYDESGITSEGWSVEGIIDSRLDGPFNFLVGGIYLENRVSDSDYFVVSSLLDYTSVVLGALPALGGGSVGASASPFFNSETETVRLKAYGLFGEVYWEPTDTLRLTGGLRYSNDDKFVRDRQTLFNVGVPYGTADARQRTGFPAFREAEAKFDEVTGRFVIDWKPEVGWADDTLFYASYSRGYKSGGINPPFDPTQFSAPAVYRPEIIDAFEIGTKNTFIGGAFRANISAFYYKYKDLQISRIINRTSFNDNTDAEIWGVEGEFLVAPSRNWLFNINASWLKTRVTDLQLVDTRDPSGGQSDAVIIKDLQSAANCVFQVKGNAALANGFVAQVNQSLGLRAPVPIPGTNTTGAFSLCSALVGAALANNIPVTLDVGATPALPAGIAVDNTGNRLPNAPEWKLSLGAQYTTDFSNGWSMVLRGDLNFTDSTFSRTFNRPIDRVPAYEIVNAQVQFNGPDDRFFIRGFVQNLFDSDAITGQYVTDPSSGLFTNVFSLEPRRYGVAVGFSF
jgi:outer membrane receptor protein involved in Fe transport